MTWKDWMWYFIYASLFAFVVTILEILALLGFEKWMGN